MSMAISVDNDFARFGSKSYAINKINSVEVRERQPHNGGGAAFCAIVSIVSLLAGLGSVGEAEGPSFGSFFISALFAFFAYLQWQKTKLREYQLFLMTSSSETQAFVTRDQYEVVTLREQIEAAMVRHSQGGLR